MAAHVPRLPFSLHALVAEAKRRARRRRVLLAVAVIALAGGGTGAVFATHPFGWLQSAESTATAADYQQGGVVTGNCPCVIPDYSTAQLSSVSAVSDKTAWIVGSVAWRWDGSAWRTVPLPQAGGDATLSAVAEVGPNDAWAVGSRQWDHGPLVEHWNGVRWRVVGLPASVVEIPGFSEAALTSVSATGPRNVWALGTIWRPARRPLLLHWNGHTWLSQPVPWSWARPGDEFGTVVATDSSGAWFASATGSSVEHWDGARWRSVPPPFGPLDGIGGFSATGWNDAWAVGSYRTGPSRGYGYSHPLAAHWDGSAWTITPVPDLPGHNDTELDSVVAVRSDDAWAIGPSQHIEISDNGNGLTGGHLQPLLVHWDGSRWSVTPVPGLADIRIAGIAAAPDGSAWAIASCWTSNVVLGWNGASWNVVPHPRDVRWHAGVVVSRRRPIKSCVSAASGG